MGEGGKGEGSEGKVRGEGKGVREREHWRLFGSEL